MADDQKPKTGLDDALSLEATYYASPIPQNLAVLTILGAVFDKVHFRRRHARGRLRPSRAR